MKTNFFRMLDRLNPTGEWKICIARKDSQMILSVLLLKGEHGSNIPPMVFSGLPEELDEGFYPAMEKPVGQVTSLFVNLAEHAQSLEEAKKAIRDRAGAKPAKSTDGADALGDKKNAFEDAMKNVQELNSACRYSDAISALPAETDYPDKKTEIEKLRAELERKAAQLSLL
ncbi:hypothetical protein ACFOG5_02475 [Pedobacter fastidiosus]|uniref:ParB-related ThiF-related cassette protein E domain-containing protein n=1 Tax=Pedobacter fastidiosus TaxID=2765361 RepID=A0ABR7KWP3_9SPHI|nr:hypothetical protein [Pedobacter fastidiosus]MBC6112450.1 hypothetical protein [Pedobacter fastidiosus]